MVVGALYRALHAQAWKLAEPSRDRDWPLQPPVPRKTQDRRYLHAAPPSPSLESQRQPRQDHHQVEVHKKAGTTEIELLIQAVTVLVAEFRVFEASGERKNRINPGNFEQIHDA